MTNAGNSKFLDIFGLKRDPFSLENAYSPVGKRHEVLEQMVHLNQFSNLVVAVVAPKGYGKSVLFDILAKQLKAEKDLIVTQFSLSSRVSGMSLLQRLSEEWKLEAPSVNRETLLRQLRNDQLKRATVGMRHCIIIDNVEYVDQDGLRALQSLTTGLPDDRSIGLTLFCDERVIDLRSIFQPIESLHIIRLQALSQRDVFAFIKDHFRIAGGKKSVPLPPDVIENIAVDSEGVPARIIELTREYMKAQSSAMGNHPEFELTRNNRIAIAVVAGAVLLGGASYLLQTQVFNPKSIQPNTVQISTDVKPLVATVPADQQAPPKTVVVPVATSKPVVKPTPVAAAVTPAVVKPAAVTPAAVTPTPEPETAAVSKAPVVTPATVAVEAVAVEAVAKPVAVVSAPQPKTVVSSAVATGILGPVSRTWLQRADANNFTIQIVASHQESAIRKYIDAQKNPEQFDYVKSSLDGSDWFIVVYGAYATNAEAKAVIAQLPDAVKEKQPWVRSVGAIRPAG